MFAVHFKPPILCQFIAQWQKSSSYDRCWQSAIEDIENASGTVKSWKNRFLDQKPGAGVTY